MKKVLFFALLPMILGAAGVNAQVRIGGDGAPHTAAVLDLNASDATDNGNLGLMLPRVSLANETASLNGVNPKDGTLVYNTNSSFGLGLYYWVTDKWVRLRVGGDFQEKDSVIGNEVLNATASGGLNRAGSGTAAAPYTLGIADNGVTTARIADNAVTTAKILDGAVGAVDLAANAVTSAKIADATIVTADLADNAVSTAKIANGAVTYAKIGNASATSGQVLKYNGTAWAPAADAGLTAEVDGIIGNEVTNATASGGLKRDGSGTASAPWTLSIADNGVTTARIADNAVTTAKILDGAVGAVDLAANAVTSAKIADATIVTADLADNAVSTAKIANGAVTYAKIGNASATSGQVLKYNGTAWAPAADAGLTAEVDGIIGNEVTNATASGGLKRDGSGTASAPWTLSIADNGVTTARIADNAVTTAKILDGAVGAVDLAANAVTTAKIADKAVTYAKIDNASASGGQVLKYTGSAWAPAAESLAGAANGLTKSGANVELGGTLTKATAIAQAGFNLYTTGTGKVSIGAVPTANSAKFEVSGAAANTAALNAVAATTIDFSQSNLAYTTASAGAFTLQNLKDGGAYTLAVQGTTSGTSTFTATNTAGASLTVKILNSMATVSGKQTLYSILVMNTTVYVFVNSGF